MTGLEADRHVIVEIATLVTDDDLTVVAEGPDLVVHATEDAAGGHGRLRPGHAHRRAACSRRSGPRSSRSRRPGGRRSSSSGPTSPSPAPCPLAGNSIGTDRRFLAAHLPEIEEYLHYRSVDVSTIKELAGTLVPRGRRPPPRPKAGGHRAMDDIRESVAELAYYRSAVFQDPTP